VARCGYLWRKLPLFGIILVSRFLELERLDMSSALAGNAGFNSVKLPLPLVNEARAAALTFRRSTAGQIEYWAMLGKAVEESGLTVRELQAVIEPAVTSAPNQVQSLVGQFVAFDRSGALAEHVRKVIANNAANNINNSRLAA
jgi:hypothetical protein